MESLFLATTIKVSTQTFAGFLCVRGEHENLEHDVLVMDDDDDNMIMDEDVMIMDDESDEKESCYSIVDEDGNVQSLRLMVQMRECGPKYLPIWAG